MIDADKYQPDSLNKQPAVSNVFTEQSQKVDTGSEIASPSNVNESVMFMRRPSYDDIVRNKSALINDAKLASSSLLKGNVKHEPNFNVVSNSHLSGATNDEFSHENERTKT